MAKFIFQAGVFFGSPLFPGDTSTQITVYDAETDLPVETLWEDEDGIVELSNPFNIAEEGHFFFYANDGKYNVVATMGVLSRAWSDVILGGSGGGDGGVDSFLELDDTPGSYSGHGYKGVRVNSGATGLEFAADDVVRGEGTVQTSSYTLSAALHDIRRDCSGDVTITIPKESVTNLSLPDNRVYMHHVKFNGGGTLIIQGVDGDVTVTPMAGADLSMSGAGQICTIEKSTITANTWFVYGNLDASA